MILQALLLVTNQAEPFKGLLIAVLPLPPPSSPPYWRSNTSLSLSGFPKNTDIYVLFVKYTVLRVIITNFAIVALTHLFWHTRLGSTN